MLQYISHKRPAKSWEAILTERNTELYMVSLRDVVEDLVHRMFINTQETMTNDKLHIASFLCSSVGIFSFLMAFRGKNIFSIHAYE